ncbi:hypothetical protein [Micromonospora mirobrigensis]|uniref:Uncharacterized protein n=1 Tax=Micromonospora mirobrigensis TaxID=262898 RepID=A0A1C4YA57_9ACTN|nr:hypothetical protein GA0070564_103663 [Micromonospora mirobrigensis]
MSESGQPGAPTPGEQGDGTGRQDDLARPVSGWEPPTAGWSRSGGLSRPVEPAPPWRQADPAGGWSASSPRHGDLPAPLPGQPEENRSARVNGRSHLNGFGAAEELPGSRPAPVSAPPVPGDPTEPYREADPRRDPDLPREPGFPRDIDFPREPGLTGDPGFARDPGFVGDPGFPRGPGFPRDAGLLRESDPYREPGGFPEGDLGRDSGGYRSGAGDRLVVPAQRPAPTLEQPADPSGGAARHSSGEPPVSPAARRGEGIVPSSAPPAVQVPPVGTTASGFEVPAGFHAPTVEPPAQASTEPPAWATGPSPDAGAEPSTRAAGSSADAGAEPSTPAAGSSPDAGTGPSTWAAAGRPAEAGAEPSTWADRFPPEAGRRDAGSNRPDSPPARPVEEPEWAAPSWNRPSWGGGWAPPPWSREEPWSREDAARRGRPEPTGPDATDPEALRTGPGRPYEAVRAEPALPYEPVRAEPSAPYEPVRAEPDRPYEARRGEEPGRPPTEAPAGRPAAAVDRPAWARSVPIPASAPPVTPEAGAEERTVRPFRLRPVADEAVTAPPAGPDPAGPVPTVPAPTAAAAATSAPPGPEHPPTASTPTSAPPYAARRSAPEPVPAAQAVADEPSPEPTSAVLPQRVPAEPDVPVVPEPPAVEPSAETPELARIATHLRRDDEPAPLRDRPEGFDVNAILDAVREVAGVRDAALRRTPAGAHSLRLDLADGADPAEVSRHVARLLQERMGLAAAPQNLPDEQGAPPPVRRRSTEPRTEPGRARPAESNADRWAGARAQSVERYAARRAAEDPGDPAARPAARRSAEEVDATARRPAEEPAGRPGDEQGAPMLRRSAEERAESVARRVAEEPAEQAGRSGDPTGVRSPGDDTPAAARPVSAPPRRRRPNNPHRGRATVEDAVAAVSAGSTGSPVTMGSSYSGGQMTTTETAPSRPLDTGGVPGPRVVIDHVQVSTFGLDATVEVRLIAGDETAEGHSTGPAVDGYVLRLCAVAAAAAVDELLRGAEHPSGRGRCFVEHAAVVPFGNCEVATVVVLLVCDGWVEQLAGSALVAGDQRQAVVRATLAAVNRRLEALLS